jgi:hypothetical protein
MFDLEYAVSQACERFKGKIMEDKEVLRIINRVIERLEDRNIESETRPLIYLLKLGRKLRK